jgi:uncharacterized membrane protein YeaQ/YmgE (transglycosylase-associated protein family)
MFTGLLLWIIVGLISGWAAGRIMKGGGYGVIMDIVLGIVGGVIGGWILRIFGIHGSGLIGSVLVSIFGAVVLIWLSRMIKRA